MNWHYVWSKLEAWTPFVALVLLGLILGPQLVSDAFTDPSGWRWFRFGLWVLVIAYLSWECVKILRRRGESEAEPVQPLAPEDVPGSDVDAAVASTSDRISAIKALREQHRGLGLKAAAYLVDTRAQRDSR